MLLDYAEKGKFSPLYADIHDVHAEVNLYQEWSLKSQVEFWALLWNQKI